MTIAPTRGFIDAHQHIWTRTASDYPWLAAEPPAINRDFELSDVELEMRSLGISGTVLVQADDTASDTDLMLRCAARHRFVLGVVGWVPLVDPRQVEIELARVRPSGKLVGVRHLIHREPLADWLLQPAVGASLDVVSAAGLTFDVCAESLPLLDLVPELARAHPDLTLVIDHLAKPPIADSGWEPWAGLLAAAAAAPNVVAKVSGLNTAAGSRASAASYRRYVDHAIAVFGPERLMYGGDWPFALQATASYSALFDDLTGALNGLSDDELAHVMGGTARRVYRLTSDL